VPTADSCGLFPRLAGVAGQGTPATVALDAAGTSYTLMSYVAGPASAGYGSAAAAALGLDPAAVFKTLVAVVDDTLCVAVVPVSGNLHLKALAAARRGKRAILADAVAAQRCTGYVLGGISPFGQRRRLPTVVDDSALRQPVVYVSAGRRGLQVAVAPADLIRLTEATVAPIGGP